MSISAQTKKEKKSSQSISSLKRLLAEADVGLKIASYPRGVERHRSSADPHGDTSWLRCSAIYADDVLVPVCCKHFLCKPDPRRGWGGVLLSDEPLRELPPPTNSPTAPTDPSQKLERRLRAERLQASKAPTQIPDGALGERGERKHWKPEGWRGTSSVCVELVPTVIRMHARSKYRRAHAPTLVAAQLIWEQVEMGVKQHCPLTKTERLSRLFPRRVRPPQSQSHLCSGLDGSPLSC